MAQVGYGHPPHGLFVSHRGIAPLRLFLARLILHDQELPPAVLTGHSSKGNLLSWPEVQCLLLAVWAFQLVFVETKIDFRHD